MKPITFSIARRLIRQAAEQDRPIQVTVKDHNHIVARLGEKKEQPHG